MHENSLHQCPLDCGTPFVCRLPLFHPRSPLSSPILTPLTVGPRTPGLRKLGPGKNQRAERKAGCMVERGEGRGGEGGVWSTGSFSIPMEQKVNDGSIVLWESWPEEKCYRESRPVPVSSDKRGPAIRCIEFLRYLYRLHGRFMPSWKDALPHPRFC